MTELYLTKNTIREYYKEEIVPWVQPVLTHNDVIGGATFSCEMRKNPVNPAFQAFDGNVSTNARISSGASPLSEFIFYNPNPLRLQTLTIDGTGNSNNEYMTAGLLYGSNDGIKWVDLATFSGLSYTAYTVQVNSSEFYKYHKIMPTGLCTAGYWTLAELAIVAEEKRTVKGSASDYTFYLDKEVVNSSIVKVTRRNYYKIAYKPWDKPGRPYLTANDSDPDFLVSADTIYDGSFKVFHSFYYSSGSVPWHAADNGKPHWYQIIFRKPIRITRIDMRNRSSQYGSSSSTHYRIKARNSDTEEWVYLTEEIQNTVTANDGRWMLHPAATKGYKQYRFDLGYGSIGFPTFTWEEEYKKPCLETDDYDGYDEEVEYIYTGASFPELKYFKRGTEANVELYGTLQNRDGCIGNEKSTPYTVTINFKSGNYALTPKYPSGVQNYECVLKFKNFAHDDGRVIGNWKTNVRAPQLEVATSATAYDLQWLHPNGGEWVSVSGNSYDLVLGEWYWLKAIWDGQTVLVYTSTDGKNFIPKNNKACTACTWTEQVEFGADVNAYFFNGEIDLKECYFKINGEMWWRGTLPVECSEEEAEWSEWVSADKPIN